MADKICEILCGDCKIQTLPDPEQRRRAVQSVIRFVQQWYYGDIVDRHASDLDSSGEPALKSFSDVGYETGLFEGEDTDITGEVAARVECAVAHAQERCFRVLDNADRLLQ